MTQLNDIKFIKHNDKYSRDAVEMWRNSKEKALGIKDNYTFDEVLQFFMNNLTKDNDVYLAIETNSDKVVGMLAFNNTEINQLYIHNDFQRLGIGTKLLKIAKDSSPGKLQLYTFEVNSGAQRFYENQGFVIIGSGSENEENLPDILYEWNKV